MFAILLAACIFAGGICTPVSATFTDIKNRDVAVAAAVLESMGIVTGMSPGIYSPETGLTRAQFCALAVRATGQENMVNSNNYKMLFTDVRPGSWYTGYVNLAYSLGLVNGYGNGKFGPEDSITYGQAATLMLRMLKYTTDDIGKLWPMDYTRFADSIGLSEGLSVGPYQEVNRGQAAILVYNTLRTELKNSATLYYQTTADLESVKNVIILSNGSQEDGAKRMLSVRSIGAGIATSERYPQKYVLSDTLVNCVGVLLLDASGRAIGFIPETTESAQITVSSAGASSIVSSSGPRHNVGSSAAVIIGNSIYEYGSGGYTQIDDNAGQTARLYYGDGGIVKYIYMEARKEVQTPHDESQAGGGEIS